MVKVWVYVEPTWLTASWKFLEDKEIKMEDNNDLFKRRREGDTFLMEIFVQQGYAKGLLVSLNRCRIYLKILTLAAMTPGDGIYIRRKILNDKDQRSFNQ